jgi:hypothetical protein
MMKMTIRIRIFIIPINGPTTEANKLHTLIIVIGGNYTYTGYLVYIKKYIYIYIYKYNVSCWVHGRKFQNYVLISIICQINQNSIIYLPMKIFQ